MPAHRNHNAFRRAAACLERLLFGAAGLDLSGRVLHSPDSWPMLRVVLVFFVANLLPASAIHAFGPPAQSAARLTLMVLQPAVALAVIWLVDHFARSQRMGVTAMLTPRVDGPQLLDWALKWGVILRVVVLAVVLVQVAAGAEPPATNNPLHLAEALSGAEQAVIVLAVVAVVPVAEELFYRGVLYRSLGRYFRLPAAAAISSVVWALLHGSLALVPALFALGLVLVALYETTETLWAPIAAHMGFNLTSFLLMWMFPNIA